MATHAQQVTIVTDLTAHKAQLALYPGPFSVLTADCPWPFEQNEDSDARWGTIDRHYAPMSMTELCLFPLPNLARDCVLFFWRVSAMQRQALDVVKAWGFTDKAELVWRKRTKHGKRHFGMGRWTRAEHETAIIATRGNPQALARNIRSTFSAPVPVYPIGHPKEGHPIHSAKPEKFYDIVERLAAGPYAELFARRRRPGWSCFGDQVPATEGVHAAVRSEA